MNRKSREKGEKAEGRGVEEQEKEDDNGRKRGDEKGEENEE